jgi:hypothetical protein
MQTLLVYKPTGSTGHCPQGLHEQGGAQILKPGFTTQLGIPRFVFPNVPKQIELVLFYENLYWLTGGDTAAPDIVVDSKVRQMIFEIIANEAARQFQQRAAKLESSLDREQQFEYNGGADFDMDLLNQAMESFPQVHTDSSLGLFFNLHTNMDPFLVTRTHLSCSI